MRKLILISGLAVIGMLVLTSLFGTVTTARADGTITWTGNGSTTCPNGCHWVVQVGSSVTSVTLNVNGELVTLHQNGNSGTWSGDSQLPFNPTGAVVTASYVGTADPHSPLQIELSHALECTSNCGTEVTPTDVTPTDVTPTDVTPTDVTPTDVTPTDVTPTDVTPTDVTPTDVTPTDVTPTEGTPGPTTTEDPNCTGKGHKRDPDCMSDYVRRYIPHTGGGGFLATIFVLLGLGLSGGLLLRLRKTVTK